MHCLWNEPNNRTRSRFESDVTWFCFCFHFVCSHAWCDCCSIVCWSRWRGAVRLKLDVQGQGGGKSLAVNGQGVGGGGGY